MLPVRYYEYRHTVTFEETNLVGNVYYVNHLRWQGCCRERFLRDHAPSVLDGLRQGLALVTLNCQCEYYAEILALDEISVRMCLDNILQNRIAMRFEYWRMQGTGPSLVARGAQQIACMHRQGTRLVPVNVPEALRAALIAFSEAAA